MSNKAVVSLSTGLEDAEKVTVALLVAVGAAESGRPTLMFLAKEAVRLVTRGVATGTACEGRPPIVDLQARYIAAGGRYFVCPICFNAGRPRAVLCLESPCLRAMPEVGPAASMGRSHCSLLTSHCSVLQRCGQHSVPR